MSRLVTVAVATVVAAVASALTLAMAGLPAAAHEPGTSAVLLTADESLVEAELQLPLDRLEIAVDLPLTEQPDTVVSTYGDTLATYIGDHMAVTGDDGTDWAVRLGQLRVEPIDGIDHLTTTATIEPFGQTVGGFTLTYDVILDYLLSHEIVVSAGPLDDQTVVGLLSHATDEVHVDRAQLGLDPLGAAEDGAGTRRMVIVGTLSAVAFVAYLRSRSTENAEVAGDPIPN